MSVWAFNIIIMHMCDELASMTNGLCALARNESQLLSNGRCHNNRINYLILITGVNPSRPPPPTGYGPVLVNASLIA